MRSNITRARVVSLMAAMAGATLLGCGTGSIFGDEGDSFETERACPADANPCTLEQRSRGSCVSKPVENGRACPGGTCQAGQCVATCSQRETSCTDGADEDCDGSVDCADSDCLGVACGGLTGCAQAVCGGSGACEQVPVDAGVECRGAIDVCDVAETCDGASVDCPSDGFAASTQSCGEGSHCDGTSASCPAVEPGPGGLAISVPLALDKTEVRIGETMHATVTYKNTSSAAVTVQNIVIAGRPPGPVQYLDFAPQAGTLTLQPGATHTLAAARTFAAGDLLGQWRSYATYRDSSGVWHDGPEITFTVAEEYVAPAPGGFVISVPLALDKTEVRIGETMHATVTYKNTSSAAITVQAIVIAGRPPGPVQYLDFAPQAGTLTLQPGATHTLSATRTFAAGDLIGAWRSYATYRDSDGVWHDGAETTFSVAAAIVEPDPGVPTIEVARNVDLMIVAGDYWADNNTWGAGSIEFGTASYQYEQYNGVMEYGSDGAVATRMVWRWPNPEGSSEVKSYPELIYGAKPGMLGPWGEPGGQYTLVPAPAPGEVVGESGNTPLPLQLPLGDLKARHRLAASNLSGYGHVSYDLWLQELPEQEFGFQKSSITHEIMIPLWNWGVPPYGNHPDGRNPAWYDHDVTIDGIEFAVYVAKDWSGAVRPTFGNLNGEHGGRTGWKFIAFQPKQLPIVARTIDLAAIVNYVATRVDNTGTPWATGSEWLMSVELGVEPNVGTGDVTIYDYKVGPGLPPL